MPTRQRCAARPEPEARAVAVAEPEPDVGQPLEVRDFGSFLDVREEGFAEGYDVGYDDGEHGRPHRKANWDSDGR